MKILLTGAAGFIGMTTSLRLLARGDEVVGLDNLNDYYDVTLKQRRLDRLTPSANFRFVKMDVADRPGIAQLFAQGRFDRVIHLAAQAGVRYSLQNPHAYVESNLEGFINILEGCRHGGVQHLTYASSSSVYGGNTKMPFSEHDSVDHPVSLYAATKKANELMAHTYSHLYGLPTTGLRFFTVYGPVKADPATSNAPYRVFNIGNNNPVPLLDFIACIEDALGKKAEKRLLPLQDGDVPATYANTDALRDWVGFVPGTSIQDGVSRFVAWYRDYYKV
jgi:UDP-glucuronate 4-epimerase